MVSPSRSHVNEPHRPPLPARGEGWGEGLPTRAVPYARATEGNRTAVEVILDGRWCIECARGYLPSAAFAAAAPAVRPKTEPAIRPVPPG